MWKPFEHEARLKELLVRQAELNAALDLDKGERQAAAPTDDDAEPGGADGAEPKDRARGRARPRQACEPRRKRECDPPADDVDVDAEEENVVPFVRGRDDMTL